MNITINRIPRSVGWEIKRISPRLAAYARLALAEKLERDGLSAASKLLTLKKKGGA